MDGHGRPWCFAPTTSLHLDTNGDVQACCSGRQYPLGNVATSSLRDIWEGERACELRTAVGRHDLSVGCGICQWEVDTGGDAAIARTFDHLEGRGDPLWPVSITFAMSNTCNLRCVMCNGEVSSSIRARVEHRPPLPDAYGDAFFDELVDFLPHLVQADFVGGEPLLARPTLRAMELLAEHGRSPAVHINTNGTVWNDHVESLVRCLRANVSVSVDGITAETFERVRRGASFDAVMENVERIRLTCAAIGRFTGITHSLMVHNWQEFPDLVIWAERSGFRLVLSKVVDPPEHSLYHLPPAELSGIVARLRARQREVESALGGVPESWERTLRQLEAHPGTSAVDFPKRRTAAAVAPDAERRLPPFEQLAVVGPADRDAAVAHLGGPSVDAGELQVDAGGRITELLSPLSGVDLSAAVGGSVEALLALLEPGEPALTHEMRGANLFTVAVARSPAARPSWHLCALAERDDAGQLSGMRVLVAAADQSISGGRSSGAATT